MERKENAVPAEKSGLQARWGQWDQQGQLDKKENAEREEQPDRKGRWDPQDLQDKKENAELRD